MISEKGMIKIRENGKRTIKILQKLREERELKKVQEYINSQTDTYGTKNLTDEERNKLSTSVKEHYRKLREGEI